MDRLQLRLIDTTFDIYCEDRKWDAVMRALWAPFIVEDAGKASYEMRITGEHDRWAFTDPSNVRIERENPWLLADEIKQTMVDLALDGSKRFVDLHAATLVRDGDCLMVIGGSGTGKTTLSLELLKSGWSYFSDDCALIDPESLQIAPFPKPLGIRDRKQWSTYRDRWDPAFDVVEPRGALLLPASVVSTSDTDRAEPAFLLFSRFSPREEARIEEVSAAEALARCGQFTRTATPLSMGVLRRLCEGTKRADFRYPSAEEGVPIIQGWISSLSK